MVNNRSGGNSNDDEVAFGIKYQNPIIHSGPGNGPAPTDWNDVVSRIRESVANAGDEGFTISVVTGNNIVIPSDVIEELKGLNGVLALHTGNGVTFSVTSENIRDDRPAQGMDLSVRPGATKIPENLLDEKTSGAAASLTISMKSREDFGMVVNLHVALGAETDGQYANLYCFNETLGEMEYLGSYLITEEGLAMFGITHGAEYLITVTDGLPDERVVAGKYIVVYGDTLSSIASRNNISLARILAMNPDIHDADKIRVGQIIKLR